MLSPHAHSSPVFATEEERDETQFSIYLSLSLSLLLVTLCDDVVLRGGELFDGDVAERFDQFGRIDRLATTVAENTIEDRGKREP